MLGRLEMDVDECIEVYTNMMKDIFKKKGLPIDLKRKFWKGKIKGRFDSSVLEDRFGQVLEKKNMRRDELFDDGKDRWCKL
jgi:hypothetical protein